MHLLLLKNLALAHIQMNEYQKAIDAADLALEIEPADAKAMYRKAYALQKRGNEKDVKDAEEVLQKMERLDLKDEKEAKEVKQGIAKIRNMAAKDRQKSKKLQKSLVSALESKPGIFSQESEREKNYSTKLSPEERYRQNSEILSTQQAFDIVEKLADGYQSKEIQDLIKEALKKRSNNPQDPEFRLRLAEIAMIVQKPILEEYGFEPNKKGLTEMLSALYQHEDDEDDKGRELKPLLGMAFGSLLSSSWSV